MSKSKRPKIDIPIQVHLWVASGGRCEFPGCNKPLWKDNLTFTPGNYSHISHIIGQSPNGPRGSEKLSKKYAKNFGNLMLLCPTHNKLIDSHPERYTINFLRDAKKRHEERIKIQTGIQLDRKTTIIRFQANIKGRKVEIPSTETELSVTENGHYPNDKGILIDLTNLEYDKKKYFWSTATNQIKKNINQLLTEGNDGYKPKHVSIFALGPIPMLVYLGFVLGNAIPADIYIKLRDKWTVKESKETVKFLVSRKNIEKSKKDVALLIAITGTPTLSEIEKGIDKNPPIYKIAVAKPGVDIIKSSSDLEKFRLTYRKLVDEIRELHGKESKIHLFGAMPACVSIVCGRELLHRVDPQLTVYEYVDQKRCFVPEVKIN